jgi:hypothetical protein
MDGLSPEEQAKEHCRDIFYEALPRRMEQAIQLLGGPHLLDMVIGGNSLLSVLYDAAPAQVDKVFMYPVRTYEILQELNKKAESHVDSSSRDIEAEAR